MNDNVPIEQERSVILDDVVPLLIYFQFHVNIMKKIYNWLWQTYLLRNNKGKSSWIIKRKTKIDLCKSKNEIRGSYLSRHTVATLDEVVISKLSSLLIALFCLSKHLGMLILLTWLENSNFYSWGLKLFGSSVNIWLL